MKIRCEELDNLLLEGDAFSLQVAVAHAGSCPECLEKLTEWNEISETARTLQTTWSSDLLWPRIEKALRNEVAGAESGGRRVWRAAAAALLTVTIGATAWYAIRDGSSGTAFDQKILGVAAIDEVERAEAAYLAAIDRLETMAEPHLDEAETPLMVSYREKLMLLDDAIAEVQMNIERNRQNAHLRKQLLSMYSEKQRTLQDLVREETHGSNE